MSKGEPVALSVLGETLSSLRLRHEAAERAMRHSLSERGQLTAVLCYPRGASLEVFDGFKRLRAARALGWTQLRVECVASDEAAAKLVLWHVHQGQGLSEIEEAWVLRSLCRDDGLPQYEIARRLGRHKSWVSRRLMLAQCLSSEVEAQVRLGLLSVTAARELCRLPRGNQDAAAQAVMQRGLTTRQTAKLIDSLLGAPDESAKARLLDAAPQPPAPRRHAQKTPGEQLIDDIHTIRNRSARLHERLLERPLLCLGQEAAQLAAKTLGELLPTLVVLCQTIQTVIAQKEVDEEYIS